MRYCFKTPGARGFCVTGVVQCQSHHVSYIAGFVLWGEGQNNAAVIALRQGERYVTSVDPHCGGKK